MPDDWLRSHPSLIHSFTPHRGMELVQRDEQRFAGLAGNRAADVPLPGRVLGKENVTGTNYALGPVAHFDFHLAFQIHHVLPARRGMKVVVVVAGGLAKHHTGGLVPLRDEADLAAILERD